MHVDYKSLQKELQTLVTAIAQEVANTALTTEPYQTALLEAHRQAEVGGRIADFADVNAHQRAVRFILQTLYVRVLEDLDLLSPTRLKGQWSRKAFNDLAPNLGLGAYFKWVLRDVAVDFPKLFEDPWHPLPYPSDALCQRVWDLWHDQDGRGNLRFEWQTEGFDSRFLGDLYQDLDGQVRKHFALLQTPEFVESYILDHTLTPALNEMDPSPSEDPQKGFRLIDPTCGSGHFLVGAFRRLFALWQGQGDTAMAAAQKALAGVWGCDINPHAVDIAAFRLILEARALTGVNDIGELSLLPLNLAVMDSLIPWEDLHKEGIIGKDHLLSRYASEAVRERNAAFLNRAFHVVVGNPPYITPKDVKKRNDYRVFWKDSCHRSYALSAPFAERFFRLGVEAKYDQKAAFVGQITANSFMKREFGRALIQNVLPKLDLTGVIDTSGAYIPGHGTPTVILFGRNQVPQKETVWTIMGKRGEPSRPDEPEKGLVWTDLSMASKVPDDSSAYITVALLERKVFEQHPWSLSGGQNRKLVQQICSASPQLLESTVDLPIGRAVRIGQDSSYIDTRVNLIRSGFHSDHLRRMLKGEEVRDWAHSDGLQVWYPYNQTTHSRPAASETAEDEWQADLKAMWNLRTTLASRRTFQGTMADAGLHWYEYMQHTKSGYSTPLSITFAFVSTHNHFVLDRGGKVFNRSAPVIKLPSEATEDDHLNLLGLLNSSTLGFWMKQVFQSKGNGGIGGGIGDEDWEPRYEYDSTKLKKAPLTHKGQPKRTELARALDKAASDRAEHLPQAVIQGTWANKKLQKHLELAKVRFTKATQQMVALQEELDWHTYHCYSLLNEDLSVSADACEPLTPGHRPFEVALAQADDLAPEGERSAWWSRHGHDRQSAIPPHYSPEHKKRLEQRLKLTQTDEFIGLLEQPAFKRRWQLPDWQNAVQSACEDWLLDHLEGLFAEGGALEDPAPYRLETIAACVRRDERAVEVASVLAGTHNVDIERLVERLLKTQAIPDNPLRIYAPKGLEKYRFWQKVWHLQDLEDAELPLIDPDTSETLATIPVPPKFTAKDFVSGDYYKLRGKLNVPRERFIAFDDLSPTHYGWNGWRDLNRVIAQVGAVELVEQHSEAPLPRPTADSPMRCGPTLGLWNALPDLKRWGDEDAADEMQGLAQDFCHQSRCPCQVVDYWQAAATEAGTLGKKRKGRSKKRKK